MVNSNVKEFVKELEVLLRKHKVVLTTAMNGKAIILDGLGDHQVTVFSENQFFNHSQCQNFLAQHSERVWRRAVPGDEGFMGVATSEFFENRHDMDDAFEHKKDYQDTFGVLNRDPVKGVWSTHHDAENNRYYDYAWVLVKND